jgi:hypothetical protein
MNPLIVPVHRNEPSLDGIQNYECLPLRISRVRHSIIVTTLISYLNVPAVHHIIMTTSHHYLSTQHKMQV